MRAHRAGRRLFREAQAVPERGFLYRTDLPVDGIPDDDVSRAVRDPAHVGVAGAVGRIAAGPGTKDCAATANLSGPRHAAVHSDGSTLLSPRAGLLQI